MSFSASRDGARFAVLHYQFQSSRYELWDEHGSLLRSGVLPGAHANIVLSADGRRLAVTDSTGAGVIDVSTGDTLFHRECETCYRVALSADGSRLLTWDEKRLELWDIAQKSSIWTETDRVGKSRDLIDVSGDGQRVMWTKDSSVFVHPIREGKDAELQLDDNARDARLSHDGSRVAALTPSTIGVWDAAAGLRPIWKIRNSSSVFQDVDWSSDDSALLVLYDSLGTALLDSATGERFANFPVTKPAAFATQEIVLPSLRYRISRGDGTWEMWPLPAPDDGPPRESLARVLSEAGLEMRGVDLLDAAPSLRHE